jgi:uncharacterized protein (TIGR03437 family)
MQRCLGYSGLALSFLILSSGALGQAILTVSPQQVSIAAPAGSSTPISRTVTVFSSSGQKVPYSVSVRYLGMTTGWLSVKSNTSPVTAPDDLTITANPAAIPAGTYLGQVTITGGAGGAVVNVFLTIESASGSGVFTASPSSVTFSGQSGQAILPSQTIRIDTTSGTATSFEAFASSTGNWLTVLPTLGTTPTSITVGATQTGLAAGTYTGTITVTPRPAGNPTVIPVTLVASGVNARNTQLVLSQPSVTINYRIGTSEVLPVPAPQSVSVTTPDEALEYTASTVTPWLRLHLPVNPVASTIVTAVTPSVFNIEVNPAGLAGVPLLQPQAGSVTVNVPGLTPRTIPVSLTLTNTPALNAYPSALNFDLEPGSDLPLEREVSITTTGNESIAFTTSVNAPWLRVSPPSANTSGGIAVITISAEPAGLSANTYTGAVTLNVQGGTSVAIPVTLTVTGDTPEIEVSNNEIDLTGLVGGPGPSTTVLVTTGESGTIQNFTVSASSTEGWLTVSPFLGTTPAVLTVGANPARIAKLGTYQGFVTVTSLLNGSQRTILVSYTVAEKAITATPASLSFVQAEKGIDPLPQTVQIAGNAPSTFTVSDVPPWLRVSPTSGPTPATVTVWVNMSVVPPGTTGGTIVVTGPDNKLTIPVAVMLLPAPAPTATPESVAFTYQIGNPAPPVQTINVASTTSEPAAFSVSAITESGGNWLVVSPTSGTTPAGLRVAINTSQLIPGRYSGTITLATAGGGEAQTIPVTLTVNGATVVVQRVLHAATLAPTPVAPGQLITVTGTGLGPADGISARPTAAGAYETRLGNMRVLFDDVPAPLLFAGADQINAIVPYALHGRLSARIQVESPTSLSVPIEVKVVDSAPGLFTVAGFGRGQAAALNADLSSNSVTNPADRGSIITVFGTGEGQTDPQGQDGRVIITDLRRPLLPVIARIGGRPAEVTYAGSASLMVSGMFQANIRIPEGVGPGSVPVEVQVGSAVSQAGVMIVVR